MHVDHFRFERSSEWKTIIEIHIPSFWAVTYQKISGIPNHRLKAKNVPWVRQKYQIKLISVWIPYKSSVILTFALVLNTVPLNKARGKKAFSLVVANDVNSSEKQPHDRFLWLKVKPLLRWTCSHRHHNLDVLNQTYIIKSKSIILRNKQ